jgi:hypothetical protein
MSKQSCEQSHGTKCLVECFTNIFLAHLNINMFLYMCVAYFVSVAISYLYTSILLRNLALNKKMVAMPHT